MHDPPADEPLPLLELAVCPTCERPYEGHSGIQVGVRLGPYYIQQMVGEGGMGRVFRAVHENLGRPVAIKVIHPHIVDLDIVQAFLREARAMNQVRHPHVIEVIDIQVNPPGQGDSYYVMEWLSGQNLYSRMREKGGRLSVKEALQVAIDVTYAMESVHKNGLVHCDLKPENIFLLERDGRNDFAKVIDFGVVKDKTDVLAELEPTVAGTPAYMAPEQARGYTDHRSDIYALGVILYEMTVGRLPFTLDEKGMPLTRHVKSKDSFPLPRKTAPKGVRIPREFQRIILKAMAVNPQGRYPSMATLREDLLSLQAALSTSVWRTVLRMVDWATLTRYTVWAVILLVVLWNRQWIIGRLVPPSPVPSGVVQGQTEEPPPAPLQLEVEVRSKPEGAQVLVASQIVGVTPCVIHMAEGPGEIEIRKMGYKTQVVKLDVRVGAVVFVKLPR